MKLHTYKSHKRSVLEAKLIAAFVSLGFLVFFVVIVKPDRQPPKETSSVHVPAPRPSIEPPRRPLDPNQEFRKVPSRWVPIDFNHYSYGRYQFATGKRISLTLKNGEYRYEFNPSDKGWFSLSNVYYVDVTGDQIPEAVVDLSHVECGGGSCDGGADLFFIYSINSEGKLKELWQFETGSYGYGCGLKSLTLEGREVRLELFGCCTERGMSYMGWQKFRIEGLSKLDFRYTGEGFINKRMEYLPTPILDVKNYRAEVHIIK